MGYNGGYRYKQELKECMSQKEEDGKKSQEMKYVEYYRKCRKL